MTFGRAGRIEKLGGAPVAGNGAATRRGAFVRTQIAKKSQRDIDAGYGPASPLHALLPCLFPAPGIVWENAGLSPAIMHPSDRCAFICVDSGASQSASSEKAYVAGEAGKLRAIALFSV